MTTPMSGTAFADPAQAPSLERTAAALTAHGFAVEILDDAAAARERVKDLIPEGATVLTGASETLRLSGIDADINASGRYASVRARGMALDRAKDADEIRRLLASPDVAVGSVNAVTETGALVFASASGSQLPGYAGGAAHAIWVVGAQKVVPDLDAALRRIEDYVLPLESARVQVAYGGPSAVNRVLILNAEPHPGRGTVLLLREAIGYLGRQKSQRGAGECSSGEGSAAQAASARRTAVNAPSSGPPRASPIRWLASSARSCASGVTGSGTRPSSARRVSLQG